MDGMDGNAGIDIFDKNYEEFYLGGTKVKIMAPKENPDNDEIEKILNTIALLYRDTLKNSENK